MPSGEITQRSKSVISSSRYIIFHSLPVSFFDTKLTGDILQRIEDNNRIEEFLTSASLYILFSFFNLFIFGIVLAVFSFKILLIADIPKLSWKCILSISLSLASNVSLVSVIMEAIFSLHCRNHWQRKPVPTGECNHKRPIWFKKETRSPGNIRNIKW